MNEIISISNVSKSFGSTQAVVNLSLSVTQGEFFGFLGPNGAGKTTTIRMITGIITPDSGSITISGFPEYDKQKTAQLLGVVPESRGFYYWMTASEYLSFFAGMYALPADRAADKISHLLSELNLNDSSHKKIGAYSRGMKQRLGLARALINDPPILILDEPTLGLDPQGQEDIQQLLRHLNASGVTIFYSSHLLHEVSNLCSRIAIINYGQLVAQGTIQELMQNTQSQTLTEVFLNLTGPKHD
jgi:ABC-type multidrug transport system ATPase subunit